MRKNIIFLASVVILAFTTNASALIEPMLPPVSYPVAGEAELSFEQYKLYVDWLVYDLADWEDSEGYLYLYQVENPSGLGEFIDEFYIQPIAGVIWEYGYENGFDIDTDLEDYGFLSHNEENFPNLAGEHEDDEAELEDVESAQLATGIGGRKLEWSFNGGDGIPSGNESALCWFVSPDWPGYYPGHANNTVAFNGRVPAPVPEPTSMLLLGMGVLGLFGLKRKRA